MGGGGWGGGTYFQMDNMVTSFFDVYILQQLTYITHQDGHMVMCFLSPKSV